jgi:hypothetical protein
MRVLRALPLALSLCAASAPGHAQAHAPVPRALSVAPDGSAVALSLPGFGMLVRRDASSPFAYACDALLRIVPSLDPPALARRDDGVLLLGTKAGLRAMTPDGCPHALAQPLPAAPVFALAISGQIAWAIAGHGLWRSLDAGEHWQQRGLFAGGGEVRGLLIEPSDPTPLYVSRARNVLSSRDAGARWRSSRRRAR